MNCPFVAFCETTDQTTSVALVHVLCMRMLTIDVVTSCLYKELFNFARVEGHLVTWVLNGTKEEEKIKKNKNKYDTC